MVLLTEIIPHTRQKTGLLYKANTMAADKLTIQGAKASAAMVLIL